MGFQLDEGQGIQATGIVRIELHHPFVLGPGPVQVLGIEQHAAVGKREIGVLRLPGRGLPEQRGGIGVALHAYQYLGLENQRRGIGRLQRQGLVDGLQGRIEPLRQHGDPAHREPGIGIFRIAVDQFAGGSQRRLLVRQTGQHCRGRAKAFFRVIRDAEQVVDLLDDLVHIPGLQGKRRQ